MFNGMNEGYSLSDIAAVTDGKKSSDGLFGGDGAWWIILLFLFAFGGFGGGFGGAGRGVSTREEVAAGFEMNNLSNGIRGIQQGLCDGFYAMNTGTLGGFADVQSALCQGFSGVNSAINQGVYGLERAITADTVQGMQNTSALANQISGLGTQMASCCCDLSHAIDRGFCDVNYNIATQSCETRKAIDNSTRSILDFLTQDKIATLTAENQTLKFAASQQAQNNYLVSQLKDPCPVPAYIVANPYCSYPYSSGCSCA